MSTFENYGSILQMKGDFIEYQQDSQKLFTTLFVRKLETREPATEGVKIRSNEGVVKQMSKYTSVRLGRRVDVYNEKILGLEFVR